VYEVQRAGEQYHHSIVVHIAHPPTAEGTVELVRRVFAEGKYGGKAPAYELTFRSDTVYACCQDSLLFIDDSAIAEVDVELQNLAREPLRTPAPAQVMPMAYSQQGYVPSQPQYAYAAGQPEYVHVASQPPPQPNYGVPLAVPLQQQYQQPVPSAPVAKY
jgi:hypothetical protein